VDGKTSYFQANIAATPSEYRGTSLGASASSSWFLGSGRGARANKKSVASADHQLLLWEREG